MRTFGIGNQKGGSGKTTTCVNLAATLGEQGRRVLVIDLDPQHSATSWLGLKTPGKGLYEIFRGRRQPHRHHTRDRGFRG
jgi:chromosome partitioning protein